MKTGEFKKVESSNIDSWSFDEAQKVITVRFKNGSAYEYPGCDKKLAKDLDSAKSVGAFVARQLSKKPYTRIDDWKK